MGVHLHLHTAEGPCTLMLGARFSYLAAGLTEAPSGVVVRAYHLRLGRDAATQADTAEQLHTAPFCEAGCTSPIAGGAVSVASRRPGAAISGTPRYLTDAESLVVLEPDWLVDVTALAGTDYCIRQWLANRLAAQPDTLHKLRGTLVHSLFRVLCQDGTVGDAELRAAAARQSLDLALLGTTTATLMEAVAPHLERLRDWRAMFGGDLFAGEASPCFETTLLCPELGLRGRVDLAFRRTTPEGRSLVSRVVELKTSKYKEEWPDPEFQVRGYYAILASQGRLAADFRAQVIYTGDEAVKFRHVPCGAEHIRDVLNRRNQAVLALLLGHAPPAGASRCRKSSSRPDCVRLSHLLGLDHCHGRDLADAAAGNGEPQDAHFYASHYRLLRLEQQATGRELAALWRSTSDERVSSGTAIALEGLESVHRHEDGRWRYRLRCANRSELRPGETVLLSDGDPVRGDVTVATLLEAGAQLVEVAAMEPVAQPRLIDRYDNGEALDRTLRGLHAWLRAPAPVRTLIYGQRGPEIDAPGVAPAIEVAGLNGRQAQALDLALRMRDYLLVQGPPGTGKTHLIACTVRALVARGERVVLSAWTNQAVDNVLHALREQGCHEFARLGSARFMDPVLAPYAVQLAEASRDDDRERRDTIESADPEALAERLREIPVLAGTVSALANPRIEAATLRRDVLILDEAAQLSVAAAVGALRLARRFMLVGDDQQLPPVVQSEEALHEGLSLSPFAQLRPEAQAAGALVTLDEQYRMHAAIAAWPSEAFYGGALVAHPSVASRLLPAHTARMDAEYVDRSSPVTDREMPVVLVDAGPEAGREVELAARAVQALIRCGVPAAQIGVVAPFRAKVAAVRRLLEADASAVGCTVDTVDRFQGVQREAMVVCLGVDGIGRRGHAFVDDPRRLNVAFTRARAKLVVIGDLARAASLPTLAGFLHHCREHGVPVAQGARHEYRSQSCEGIS